MYVTKPLSISRKFPSTISAPAAEASSCGYMVVTDEESEQQDTYCWGLCKNNRVSELPFPQDRILKVVHLSGYEERTVNRVWFIPVLDLPLSSHRYYVIKAKGKHKGKACACSIEEDTGRCCSNGAVKDAKPRPFNHRDIYQQFEICHYPYGGFYAKSVAHDGFPPKFLRRAGWEVHTAHSYKLRLREARGLNASLLLDLPELNVPASAEHSDPIVIGKWYCPFVFIKEESCRAKEQMKRSLFYELSLEVCWERIHDDDNRGNDVVIVNASVESEVARAYGRAAEKEDRRSVDGFVWFRIRSAGDHHRRGKRRRLGVGLRSVLEEKMRWLQEREGWVDDGRGRNGRVERVEETRSEGGWERFGCYVLVHSFVLRRMDGSLLLKRSFRHTHRVRCIWE